MPPKTRVIQATSIGAPLAEWFAQQHASIVLARYASTLQLQGNDGRYWSIVARDHPGPLRIVASVLPAWEKGAQVRIHKQELSAQDVSMTWRTNALWNPCVQPRSLTRLEKRKAAAAIARTSTEQLPEAGDYWNDLAASWEPFAVALQTRDTAPLRAILDHLVGRGPGLTPAGDDFLQALLITLASGDETDRQAFAHIVTLLTPLLNRTTPVSRMFLHEACQGWASGHLKTLLQVLPDVIPAQLAALQGIGATSGTASILGVLFGLSWQDRATRLTLPL